MFHPSRVFLDELLVNSNYSYVHSWQVSTAMQLAVIKIVSLKVIVSLGRLATRDYKSYTMAIGLP